MAIRRIGIMGAGAIGSVVGGMLTKADYDVTLIDQWPPHIEAMKANGLTLSGSCGDHVVPARAVRPEGAEPLDRTGIEVRAQPFERPVDLRPVGAGDEVDGFAGGRGHRFAGYRSARERRARARRAERGREGCRPGGPARFFVRTDTYESR